MLLKLSKYASYLYIKSSLKNQWVIDGIMRFINLPILAKLYYRLYYPMILRKLSSRPQQIAIETYNICNLKCIMCPYLKMSRPKMKMPMGLFQKIVDDASQNGFTEINLTLYSEPLLDDLIFERIAYAKGKGLKVGLTSNGTLLTNDKSKEIIESRLDWIFLSIDGNTKESYERIRVGANFEDTCANIRELIKLRRQKNASKPLIIIHSTVLTKDNLHASKLLMPILKGADHFTMALADSRREEKFFFARNSFLKVHKTRLYPCPILWGAPSVMSNGKVNLCCKDYDGSIELGDLNKQTIEEIMSSDKLNKIKELHLRGEADKIELCKNCDSLYRASLSWWVKPEIKV